MSRNATTKTFNVSNSEKYSALKYNIDNDKKLKVIYNGLVSQTKENILNKQDNLRKKLKIKDSSYIIGNMARVESQKNPQLFNNIAHKAYSNRKDIAFIWIGDGSLKNKVQQNSSDNTYFLNFSEKILIIYLSLMGIYQHRTMNGYHILLWKHYMKAFRFY